MRCCGVVRGLRPQRCQPPGAAGSAMEKCRKVIMECGETGDAPHRILIRGISKDTPRNQLSGAHTMPKELKNKREEKKKAALTPKEKKAAKRAKKEAKPVGSA